MAEGRYCSSQRAAQRRFSLVGSGGKGVEISDVALRQDSKRVVKTRVAQLVLHDLVNAPVGFEFLASETNRPSKSLHRMLSENGSPSMDNLAAIFGAVRKRLGVAFETHAVEATRVRTQ